MPIMNFSFSHFTHSSDLVNIVFCWLTLLNHWIEYWPVEGHGIQEYLPSTECPPRAKSLKYIFISVGVQGMSPQHEPQCHTHYFELKLLEKLRTQEGNSDPPLSPWKQEINLMQNMPSLPLEAEGHPYHQRLWIQSWKVCINKLCYCNYCRKPKLCIDVLH